MHVCIYDIYTDICFLYATYSWLFEYEKAATSLDATTFVGKTFFDYLLAKVDNLQSEAPSAASPPAGRGPFPELNEDGEALHRL
jgi:hypothetical protein